jgi:tetratricopeptide (TPR) repeat protein
MKIFTLFIICFCFGADALPCLADAKSDFYRQLDQYQQCGSNLDKKPQKEKLEKEMFRLLGDWSRQTPRDVEVKIAYANLYFSKSISEILDISASPPEEWDISLKDDKTGKVAGSIHDMTRYDPALVQKAVDQLDQALALRPDRLDVYFGIAHILRQAGRLDDHYKAIVRVVEYVQSHPRQTFLCGDDKPLGIPSGDFVRETLQDYVREHYDAGNAADEEMALKLARLLADKYPQSAYGFNSMSIYYVDQGDWNTALKYMRPALDKDPKDVLVLMNIGRADEELHQVADARKCYERVIQLDSDAEKTKAAKKCLQNLGKP